MKLEDAMNDAEKAVSIRRKFLIVADPGHKVLALFTNGKLKSSQRFAVSSGQRAEYLKTKHYAKIRQQIQDKNIVDDVDNNNALEFLAKLEVELSKQDTHYRGSILYTAFPSLKATKLNDLSKYCQFLSDFISDMKLLLRYSPTISDLLKHQKQVTKDIHDLQINIFPSNSLVNTLRREVSMFFQIALDSFYKHDKLRKLKLQSVRNNKAWEQHVLKELPKLHQDIKPEDVVIVFGSYKRQAGHKGSKPTMGVKLMRLLRNAGYEVYEVNESYTSMKCSNCRKVEAECYNFKFSERKKWVKLEQMKNPSKEIPQKYSKSSMVHGLLKCGLCSTIFQRDVNGSNNIYFKVECIINGSQEYEIYLCKYN